MWIQPHAFAEPHPCSDHCAIRTAHLLALIHFVHSHVVIHNASSTMLLRLLSFPSAIISPSPDTLTVPLQLIDEWQGSCLLLCCIVMLPVQILGRRPTGLSLSCISSYDPFLFSLVLPQFVTSSHILPAFLTSSQYVIWMTFFSLPAFFSTALTSFCLAHMCFPSFTFALFPNHVLCCVCFFPLAYMPCLYFVSLLFFVTWLPFPFSSFLETSPLCGLPVHSRLSSLSLPHAFLLSLPQFSFSHSYCQNYDKVGGHCHTTRGDPLLCW